MDSQDVIEDNPTLSTRAVVRILEHHSICPSTWERDFFQPMYESGECEGDGKNIRWWTDSVLGALGY